MNGSVPKDEERGKFTTTRSSVVDYFICNADFFKFVRHFDVLDFNCLYSDIHMPLTCHLNCITCGENELENVPQRNLPERIKSWDPTKSNEFCTNISALELLNIEQTLDNKISDPDNIHKSDVDLLFNNTANLLLSSAKTTFGTFLPRTSDTDRNKRTKQWFNDDCYKARKFCRKTKRRYKLYGSNIFKQQLQDAERKYKSTLNKAYKDYRAKLQRKIKKLRSSNPKEYWNIVNGKGPKEHHNINIVDFYKHLMITK